MTVDQHITRRIRLWDAPVDWTTSMMDLYKTICIMSIHLKIADTAPLDLCRALFQLEGSSRHDHR